jgi:hypothetical protein
VIDFELEPGLVDLRERVAGRARAARRADPVTAP